MAVTAPAGGSLELANATRFGTASASAFELWQVADREAHDLWRADGTCGGVTVLRTIRCERYRHALIHAGLALTRRGDPFKRCPICRGVLSA